MNDNLGTRGFLIFCTLGLVPIALSYGVSQSVTMGAVIGIKIESTNLTHVLRAVMGLYFGMVVLWLWDAFDKSVETPARVGCAFLCWSSRADAS